MLGVFREVIREPGKLPFRLQAVHASVGKLALFMRNCIIFRRKEKDPEGWRIAEK